MVSSDFINEAFALRANLEPWQIGLGHAFEINPATPDQVVYQIADAQLIRQLFPGYPLKYMPPTKYMPGDIFQGHIIDGMFNFTGIFTGQQIMLLGMLTEALHTPLLQDRYLCIKNAKYVFESCRDLAGEVELQPRRHDRAARQRPACARPPTSSSTCARSACSRRSRTASSPT